MDIQSMKLELVKQILETNSKEIITQIMLMLKKEDKDFWHDLTDAQKDEIELGLKQIENGESISFEDFIKKVS